MICSSSERPLMTNHQHTSQKPVEVAVRHDLSIELYGDGFSVKRKLTIDEALGLMGLLSYVVREHAYKASKAAEMVVTQ